jgi:hypothetical protein
MPWAGVRNNILAGNGGYGFVGASGAGSPADFAYDGNAYWNNTSGTRSNLDDTTTNPVNGSSPYVNSLDVILTADPFVDKAGNDFRLNSTAGGGAACRGHGTPASWPGNTLTVGYPDLGAAQHQDSGGGGGSSSHAVLGFLIGDAMRSESAESVTFGGSGAPDNKTTPIIPTNETALAAVQFPALNAGTLEIQGTYDGTNFFKFYDATPTQVGAWPSVPATGFIVDADVLARCSGCHGIRFVSSVNQTGLVANIRRVKSL